MRVPVLRRTSIVEMRKDRPATDPESFDQIVKHRQPTQPAKIQMEFRIQVDGFFELLELWRGALCVDVRQCIDIAV